MGQLSEFSEELSLDLSEVTAVQVSVIEGQCWVVSIVVSGCLFEHAEPDSERAYTLARQIIAGANEARKVPACRCHAYTTADPAHQ